MQQDRGGLWNKITARFYENRSEKLRTGVPVSEMDDFRSIFTSLKSVFLSFMLTL
jgi:hypothetical protein